MAVPAAAQAAFEEARALTRKIGHYYALARTNDPRREWYCKEADRLEPLLARLKHEAMQ